MGRGPETTLALVVGGETVVAHGGPPAALPATLDHLTFPSQTLFFLTKKNKINTKTPLRWLPLELGRPPLPRLTCPAFTPPLSILIRASRDSQKWAKLRTSGPAWVIKLKVK